jgi:ribonuclease E
VLVEGEAGYRRAKDFMKMIMPSHAKNVKHHADPMPIFAKFKVEGYLADMFNPVVQLKSGGYIVIGVTEALVAIDVNSGRATKEGSIEETATKTNLEAAEEVARQVRLRDLAGLLVIDFIDMDERRNNAAVEKRLKDKLKTDRARIQVGRISAFGLLEMSRQRLRPGMLEATTQPCSHCHGTGLLRSDDSLGLSILRQLEEEGTRGRAKEVLLTAPVGIVNFLINNKRDYIEAIEARTGLSIRIEADAHMISPDFKIERFKTATRRVAAVAPITSMDAALMDEIEDEAIIEEDEVESPETLDSEEQPKKKRRRRRGGRGRRKTGDGPNNGEGDDASETEADGETDEAEVTPDTDTDTDTDTDAETGPDAEADADQTKNKPRGRRSGKGRSSSRKDAEDSQSSGADTTEVETAEAGEPAPEAEIAEAPEPVAEVADPAPEPEPEPEAEPEAEAAAEPEPQPEPEPEPEPVAAAEPEPAVAEAEADTKPKKRGWWSIG